MPLNPANEDFAAHLKAQLPSDIFRPLDARYLEEPRGRFFGRPGILALPRTVGDVSTLLKAANAARVGVVPYGGGTGLVGGQVMPDGPSPLIVSTERMSDIRAVYPDEGVLVVGAGAILADVQQAALEKDLLFPLSLASEGSARIGGTLSTNAGGVNVLRYGNTRALCLGLEAVLPDGEIWNGLTRLRKDNTGYDLKNLLIGAEGTLGIITAASLKLSPIPANLGTAMFVVPSPAAALRLLSLARAQVGETVSVFELIHGQGFEFLSEVLPQVRQPFETAPEWCVLIELGLAQASDPQTILMDLFHAAVEQGLASDGVIAQSQAQRHAFWTVREQLPEANRRIGSVSSHDISLPLGAIAGFLKQARDEISRIGEFRINCFGHLGDGNLHYNVFPPKGRNRADFGRDAQLIKRAVYDLTHQMGGSFSAEHGVGRLKVDELQRYGDPTKLAAMAAIKAALDPNGIMNPGAVLGA